MITKVELRQLNGETTTVETNQQHMPKLTFKNDYGEYIEVTVGPKWVTVDHSDAGVIRFPAEPFARLSDRNRTKDAKELVVQSIFAARILMNGDEVDGITHAILKLLDSK